jgi:hypothetical protein
MTSNDLDKLKSQNPAGSLPTRPAKKNYTLDSYLRNSLEELDASFPKVNEVTTPSRLDKNSKFSPDFRGENALVQADKWGHGFETSFPSEKRPRKLFRSLLAYLAIAILSGGLSGGALLYCLLHYAVPRDTESSSAVSAAPGIVEAQGSDRPVIERSLAFNPVSKAVSLPPDSVERQDGPAENASGQSRPPELNRDAAEVMEPPEALPATTGANAKEPDTRGKTAAIPPIAEPAPIPSPVPRPAEIREDKPAGNKADPGAAKPGAQLPKLSADQEDRMLKRGDVLLGQNDIAGARLIFQYLAHHGSPRGAFALAESYDPKKWTSHHVTGMTPDGGLARTWYARAAELGSKEAAAVLRKDNP